MPFLKAGLIKHTQGEERILSEIAIIKRKSVDTTIPIFPSEIQVNNSQVNENHDKGAKYELYIGSLYEKKGYKVDYNGIKKGGKDYGIDLICHSGRYTEVVQCKCYSNHSISRNDIFQFYGASKYYASRHIKEVVSCSFWTTVEITDDTDVFDIAVNLGIGLHSSCKMPENFDCNKTE